MSDSNASPLRGFVAGAVGGLAGSYAKMLCEQAVPPRPEGRKQPPEILVENVANAKLGHDLDDDAKGKVVESIHWTFGTLTGALYGALREVWPTIGIGRGTGYGIAVWLFSHETTLPALSLTPGVKEMPVFEQADEFANHAVYGYVLDLVRGLVRRYVLT